MKVQELMTSQPETCGVDTNLAAAVQLLWDADCGILPVVDAGRHVIGVITDRDICIALGTRNLRASDIRVGEAMTGTVETCQLDEDVRKALERMRDRGVRRLPVVDSEGVLTGILSLDDAVLATAARSGVRAADVIEALRSICSRRLPAPAEPVAG
ncbi:MAG TPA: CBS domain-containing protein [Vicinamibacterales bacterium]|nr:CBS domain-containing protein [Vicinamibacterales bacterium]